jgi:hypothetical protein
LENHYGEEWRERAENGGILGHLRIPELLLGLAIIAGVIFWRILERLFVRVSA